MEQRTDEWFSARLGHVTASRVSDVLSKIKTGESSSRKNYRTELVIERLTNQKSESFVNNAMQRGVELEPLARAAYEVKTGNLVDEVGFVKHPKIEWFGCSPDGLVNDDGLGLIEIKIPNSATHLDYLESGKPPNKYITQMMAQMACTGREWCDFVSFDDRLPDGLQLLVIRVFRDEKYILMMENEIIEFLEEVESNVVSLNKRMEKSNG